MNNTESSQKKLILKGRENFIEWTKRFHGLVVNEDWWTVTDGVYKTANPEKGKEAKKQWADKTTFIDHVHNKLLKGQFELT